MLGIHRKNQIKNKEISGKHSQTLGKCLILEIIPSVIYGYKTLSVRWQAHLRDPQTQPQPPKPSFFNNKKLVQKSQKLKKTGCAYSEHYTN